MRRFFVDSIGCHEGSLTVKFCSNGLQLLVMPESRFEEALKTMASVMRCGKVEGEFYGCQLPELLLLFFPYGQDEAAVWERRTVQGELRSH